MLHAWVVVDVVMMTFALFTAGWEPLSDDVACSIGTCVATMTHLRRLRMSDLSLHVMKTLADRSQPLEPFSVWSPPSLNQVSVSLLYCVSLYC